MKEGKIEKIESKESPSLTLDRYFNKEELSKKELEIVEEYRKECIEEIKEKAYRFTDMICSGICPPSPDGFTYEAGLDFKNKIRDDDVQDVLSSINFKNQEVTLKKTLHDNNLNPLRGATVVDLGSGMMPRHIARQVFSGNAKKYIAVDLEPPNIESLKKDLERDKWEDQEVESVESDMLEYLLKLKDQSSTVVSSGSTRLDEVIRGEKGVAYLRFLAHEIARVTPEKGITYHYEYEPLFANYLEKEGLKRIKDSSSPGMDDVSGLWVKMPEKKRKKKPKPIFKHPQNRF